MNTSRFAWLLVLSFGLLMLCCGCQSDLSADELRSLILEYDRGIVVGVELGDPWETVKAGGPNGMEVKAASFEGYTQQFYREWPTGNGTPDKLEVYFQLNESEEVSGLMLRLYTTGTHVLSAAIIRAEISDHLDTAMYATDDFDSWRVEEFDGTMGAKLTSSKTTEPEGELIELRVDDISWY